MKDELLEASMKFDMVCFNKLKAKERLGWSGWDDIENKDILEERFMKHIKKPLTQDNLVDIANFCNFLWNLIEAKKEVKKIE